MSKAKNWYGDAVYSKEPRGVVALDVSASVRSNPCCRLLTGRSWKLAKFPLPCNARIGRRPKVI